MHNKNKIGLSRVGSIAVKKQVIYTDNQVVKVRDITFQRKVIKRSHSNLYYLDNAAATPVDPAVEREMQIASKIYGNPSSFNDAGREARKKINESRLLVARFLGAQSGEVVFTSSGSESNNMAILGKARAFPDGGEIITTVIEHKSVLEPVRALKKEGWKITHLRVDKSGLIDIEELKKKLNSRVRLVSVMYANNEIGSIQPIAKIGKILKEFNKKFKDPIRQILFHVDACQASVYLDMNVNNLGVNLMTFNGSKIYGPRGSAVLYKKRGVRLEPLVYGGDQEYNLRAGTENLPAIAGLAKAISLIDRKRDSERDSKLRDYFMEELIRRGLGMINGPFGKDRLPNNINISIQGISDEHLLLELDKYRIRASSGSACTARSVEPSHVLKAIGVDKKHLGGALRFSLGRQTTKKEIDYVLKVLSKTVADLKKRYKSTI